MKKALHVFDDLPNSYAQTNVAFSPNKELFLTGTSVEKNNTTGVCYVFTTEQKWNCLQQLCHHALSILRFENPKTSDFILVTENPIAGFISYYLRNGGGTHILYDPTISERGALVCVARAPRKKSLDDFQAQPIIHNPHALPLFRDQLSRKRQCEKTLKDPLKAHKPELPMTGPGHGRRVGSTTGSLLTQYLLKVTLLYSHTQTKSETSGHMFHILLQQGDMIKETWMDDYPREAILKYADVVVKDPKYIAPADAA
ncbi:WD repeat-containing protein 70-like [Salvia splendens]|uniref:WD repeat-containing protein 70-like n=1 Tax=Salvia splendens TaxID=180675 RepID=UPI001C262BB4|nr:WD repeat-containing protein 70-like [Salvia splendens]